jgi:predicted N-acetyltransferase YhbS
MKGVRREPGIALSRGVTSRRSYADEGPELLTKVRSLLGAVFPGFAEAERAARHRGLRWEACSTPFVAEEDGAVVGHVGLLALTFVVEGTERSVGGIHAVAARADRRGRGLARRLLADAVRWGLERHEGLLLTTGSPAVYRGVGFAVAPEHRFVCSAPPPCGRPRGRWLDWDDPADLALLRSLLASREPVSARLGVVRERDVFLFATARARLWLIPELECVAWMTRHDRTLVLHDLVAERVPTLAELLACVPGPVEQVVAELCPDRLAADFVAQPHVIDGDDHLMVCGAALPLDRPIALPRTARC